MKKLKTISTKVGKIFFVLTMIISMTFSQMSIVDAWDNTVPHEFTRVKNIKYPEWWGRKVPGLSNWSTYSTRYNGNWAYCLESSKNSPPNGNFVAEVIENNEAVRKLLYYGFGGPAPWGQFADGYDLKEAICPNDNYLTNDDVKYLLTHIFLSGAYSGDWNGFSEIGFNQAFGGSYGSNIMGIYRDILNLPEPSYAYFNPGAVDGRRAEFTASFDADSKQQITNTVKLEGNSSSTVNIPMAENVTVHIMETGVSQTGGTVTIHGGQSFYFTAPCDNSPANTPVTDVTGVGCQKFTALAIKTGSSNIQTEGSWVWDPDNSFLYLKIDWMDFGKIEISKTNTNTDLIDGSIFNLKATSYDGYSKNITVDNGKLLVEYLPIGTYELKEIQAPDGYLLNNTVYTLTVGKDQTTTQTVVNEEPRGSIDLTKEINTDLTNGLLGEAYLEGNEYTLRAKEKITNKAGTITYFEKDGIVDKQVTDKTGHLKFDNLYLGKYYIEETKSNDSLVLNPNDINISIDYEGQNVSKILRSSSTDNRVNMQKIQVFKSGEKDGISGIVKGLQGAEFTFKLKSEVDHVGWGNATTYAVITTDKNGLANTPYLPYGQYLVKETVTPKDYITAPDFLISVTDDYTEYKDIEQVKRVNINNRPFTSQLKLIKVDKDSGKTVTLNSASFKIKDSKGNYVTQKVAGKKYDTFTTNSQNQITVLFGDKGEVTLPLQLEAGDYSIEEVKIPEGFLSLEKPIQFTITNRYDYDKDEDKDPILTVKIQNDQPKGRIILKKTDKETEKALADVEYELTAKKDIISVIDGTILFKKGSVVAEGITNADGQIIIDNLYMGHYELKETLTNDGYVLSEEVHDIVLEQKDLKTKEYIVNIDVTNIAPKGEIHLVKTDKDTQELLSGVIYQLIAKDDIYSLDGRNTLIFKAGDTISKDISEDGRYMTNELGEIHISNLPLGKYLIKEVKALDGYATDQKEYEIDLNYDGSDKTIYTHTLNLTNSKTLVEISKKDISTSQELAGAQLTLFDKDNNIVETWTSSTEPHIIRGLNIGEKYRLHEDLAPLGYIKADDIEFIVRDSNEIQKIEMVDDITRVEISKQDITNGKELAGAKLQIIDSKNQIIHEWISTDKPELFEKLPVGEYVLREISAPEGYEIAEDVKFTVNETSEIQKVVMKDAPIQKIVVTGDDVSIALYISGIGLAVIGIAVLVKKRKNKSDNG